MVDIATIGIHVDTRQVETGTRNLNTFGRAADDVGRSTGRLERSFSSLHNTANPLVGVLGKLAAAFSAAAITKSIYDAAIAVDKFNIGLKYATGSAEAGAKSLEYVRLEAQRLGIDFQASAEAFTGLAAAAKGTALEGDKTKMVFTAVAEAASVMQLSSDQTKGALTALQQMISKGTVQAEELRGQLGERLPGAFQIAARAMGVTTQELGKMLEQGQVVAEDFLPKFARQLHKEMGEGLKDAIDSPVASINRLKNALFELEGDAGGGFLKGLSAGASELAKALSDPQIKQAAQDIGNALGEALKAMVPVIKWVSTHLEEIGIVLAAALGGAAVGIVLRLVGAFATMVTGVGGVISAMAGLAAGTGTAVTVLRTLGMVLMATPWGRIAALIAAVGVAGYEIYQKLTSAEESATKLTMAMPPLTKETQHAAEVQDLFNQELKTTITVSAELAKKRQEALKDAQFEAEQMKRLLDAYQKSNEAGERYKDRIKVENELRKVQLQYGAQDAKQLQQALEQQKTYEQQIEKITEARKKGEEQAKKDRNEKDQFLKQLAEQETRLKLEIEYFGQSTALREAAELRSKALTLGLKDEAAARLTNIEALSKELAAKEAKKEADKKAAEELKKQQEFMKDTRSEALDATQSEVEQLERWKTETLAKVSQATEGYEKFAQDVETIFARRLPDAKKKDLEASKDVHDGMTRGWQKYVDEVNDFASLSEKIVSDSFKGMEDAMVSMITKGKFDFKSFADSIIADMTRMAIRQMIVKPLMSFMGFADGGVFSGGNVIPFANGGVVDKPTIFPMANGTGLMGEAGPEAIMPLTRTPGGELGVRSMGASGGTIVLNNVNNISVSGGSNDNSTDQELAKSIAKEVDRTIEAKVNQALRLQMRPGNMLNSGISV